MSIDPAIEAVHQRPYRGENFPHLFGHDLVTVEAQDDEGDVRLGIHSAVLPRSVADKALETESWEIDRPYDRPHFLTRGSAGGVRSFEYLRFGGAHPIEPLVVVRYFDGALPITVEISQEFCLLHNLAGVEPGYLSKLNDEGEWERVVAIRQGSKRRVAIRRRELLEFAAAKDMVIALYADRVQLGRSPSPFEGEYQEIQRGPGYIHEFFAHPWDDFGPGGRNIFSRVHGKLLIVAGPEWHPMRDRPKRTYAHFIVDVDHVGNEVEHSSDPEQLNESAEDGASWLTPVFFRRAVLAKYYADGTRYAVSESTVERAGVWQLHFDGNHEKYVIAYLGYLGRDLPPLEQAYWRTFNIPPPSDGDVSDPFFRSTILGEHTEPDRVDHVFRYLYEETNAKWRAAHGWPLFQEVEAGDEYILGAIRVPLSESPEEFDTQVGHLAKLMVQFINEPKLDQLGLKFEQGWASISKLGAFCRSRGVKGTDRAVRALRDIHDLRHGSSHRKGSEYLRNIERLGFDGMAKQEIVRRLLLRAVEALRVFNGACA